MPVQLKLLLDSFFSEPVWTKAQLSLWTKLAKYLTNQYWYIYLLNKAGKFLPSPLAIQYQEAFFVYNTVDYEYK